MDKELVSRLPLFHKINNQLSNALAFMKGTIKHYQKGESLLHIGDLITNAGIILNGSIEESCVIKNYHKITLHHLKAGQLFGTNYAIEYEHSPFQLVALNDCQVLWVDLNQLTNTENLQDKYQKQLAINLLHILAKQGINMTKDLHVANQQTIHDKIIAYIHTLPQKDGIYHIPYNQTELAEHLGINRSALARTIKQMKEMGEINVRGQNTSFPVKK